MKRLTGVASLLSLLLGSGTALAGDPYGEMVESAVSNPVVLTFSFIIWFVTVAFFIAAQWKLFAKAGEPGWAALVPIYNMVVMMKIAGKPEWWVILLFVPIANIVAIIIMYIGLARNFGRGDGFAVGLIFFPYIFLLILGFDSSRYLPVA
ncbi:MAG: hypothetical protein J7K88_05655 [Candidatus Fermentibacteraceae bacterium]|nr:hypothetical protein [Candidatus Fermentibacteraceae bacterium]